MQSIVVGDARERATIKYKSEEEGSNHRMRNCGPMMLLAMLQLVLVREALACESDHPMACAPPRIACSHDPRKSDHIQPASHQESSNL